MRKITLVAFFKIHSGKESEFKDLIPQLIEKVKAHEPGAERYDWFADSSGTTYHVIETYSDSDAVMAHMGNCGELLGKILAVSDLTGDLYGTLSPKLQEAAGNLPFRNFLFSQGL